MNVCLVSQEYPPHLVGGIGTQTFLKAQGLARLGHQVHVVTSSPDGERGRWNDGDVLVHQVGDAGADTPFSLPALHWFSHSQAVAAKLYELQDDLAFDIVEFPEYGAEGFVYLLDSDEHRNVPVVVMLHGSLAMFAERTGWPEAGSPFQRFGTFMEETVVRGADLLLAASENIAEFWALRGIAPERIRVTHTAVDTDAFAPHPAARNGGAEVLFVGRIDDEKGVLDVVGAVAGLVERHPGLRCRIVGTGEPEDEGVLRLRIALSGLESRVELVGHVPHDKLPPEYARCDVFAAPAPRDHGLASVYLEAMACARPVVASTTGGAPEAVVDGETGFLVSPSDDGDLERALDLLLSSPELRVRLGRSGRARVLERFSVERLTQRTLAAYEEAISLHGRR